MIFVCSILRKFHINSLYIFPPHPYTVATLPWEIQKVIFQQYWYTLRIICVSSEENKLLFPYPPHLKNVTTLLCKMYNFFIWLKVCCIPPKSKRKKAGCGLALLALKRTALMCSKWNSGKQRHSKCSKWPPSVRIRASSVFSPLINCIVHHALAKAAKIQPMSQRFRNSSVSRIGTQYAWKK